MFGKRMITSIVCLCWALFSSVSRAESQIVGGSTVTKLIVYNSTGSGVIVNIALNAVVNEDGCPTTISQLRVQNIATSGQISITSLNSSTTSGYFVLPKQSKVQIYSAAVTGQAHGSLPSGSQTYCLQSLALGFGQVLNFCPVCAASAPAFPSIVNPTSTNPSASAVTNPGPAIPFGTNAYECNLNRQTANEAADISCVNGANSILQQTYLPPAGGPYWNIVTCQACGGNPSLSFAKCFQSAVTSENSWINFGPAATTSTGCSDSNTNNAGTGLISSSQFGCDNNCVAGGAASACERPGVQPYGATQCNVCPDTQPITCQGQTIIGSPIVVNQFCRVEFKTPSIPNNSGCSFNRTTLGGFSPCQPASNPAPSQYAFKYGGTVQVTYKGPAVPQSCPNLTNPCSSLPKQSGGTPAAGTGGIVRTTSCN